MKLSKFKSSEITPENFYINRRQFLKKMGIVTGTAFASQNIITSALSYTPETERKITPYKFATTYNNYYEFGTSKSDPHKNSKDFITKPWDIKIDGEVENEITLSVEEIKNMIPSEERIYRFRCVEGWSMVVPWLGFPLSKLLNKVKPTSKAKFVKFTSVYDPDQMKGQRFPVLNWPYKEGLRIDEAMHPLTIMVTGLYGKELPNQNGAPLRLIVPWKYGWMNASPKEYGFYSNVNPNVSHPRWSQATERVIGENIYSPRIKTVMFNGYGDEVAGLYDGMDLRKNF